MFPLLARAQTPANIAFMKAEHKTFAQYAWRRSPDQDARAPARHPVVIIGAGPVGLALAIDLAQRGVRRVVLLDDADRIGDGSRAICFAKRTLEIFDRLGVGKPALDKGVEWRVGKVFHRQDLLYQFDLLPEAGHKMPAFINIQQYYVEKFLIDRALRLATSTCAGAIASPHSTVTQPTSPLTIDTPDGPYTLDADWVDRLRRRPLGRRAPCSALTSPANSSRNSS